MIYDFKRAKRIKDVENLGFKCLLIEAFFIAFDEKIATIFMILSLACWVVLRKIDVHREIAQSSFFTFISIFAIFSFLSIFVSPNKFFSFYNYYHLVGSYLLTYFLTLQFIKDEQSLRKILIILFLASTLTVCYAFWQILADTIQTDTKWVDPDIFPTLKNRIFSTFENPNIFAGYLAEIIAFSIGFALIIRKKSVKIYLSLFVIFLIIPLILTYARGAFLALVFTIIFYGLLREIRLVFVVSLGIALLLYVNPLFFDRISSILYLLKEGFPLDTSLEMRIALFESTVDMIFDHLFFGIGWGAYYLVYPFYDFYIQDESIKIVHAHNIYLNYLAEIGIFGAGAFFIFFFGTLKNAWVIAFGNKSNFTRATSLGIFLALLTVALGGLSDDLLFNTKTSLFFWLSVGILSSMEKFQTDKVRDKFLQKQHLAKVQRKLKYQEKIKNKFKEFFPRTFHVTAKNVKTVSARDIKQKSSTKRKNPLANKISVAKNIHVHDEKIIAIILATLLNLGIKGGNIRILELDAKKRKKVCKIKNHKLKQNAKMESKKVKDSKNILQNIELANQIPENSFKEIEKNTEKKEKILIERTEIIGNKNVLRQVFVDKEEYEKILQDQKNNHKDK